MAVKTITYTDQPKGGWNISHFIGGASTNSALPTDNSSISQIGYNLIPHTHILDFLNRKFPKYNIRVVEGLYVPEENESLTTDSVLDLRTKGRACVYEVIGLDGNITVSGTFDAAYEINENMKFDLLCLDYDNYDPFGNLNAQLVVTTPKIIPYNETRFKMQTETLWNGTQIGKEELILLSSIL